MHVKIFQNQCGRISKQENLKTKFAETLLDQRKYNPGSWSDDFKEKFF